MSCPVPFSILMCGNSAARIVRMESKKQMLSNRLRETVFTSPPGRDYLKKYLQPAQLLHGQAHRKVLLVVELLAGTVT
jgi:hypothetical protein